MRDQLKHIDAANRREKMKYADFELVSTIPDHFKVKGIIFTYTKGKTTLQRLILKIIHEIKH